MNVLPFRCDDIRGFLRLSDVKLVILPESDIDNFKHTIEGDQYFEVETTDFKKYRIHFNDLIDFGILEEYNLNIDDRNMNFITSLIREWSRVSV